MEIRSNEQFFEIRTNDPNIGTISLPIRYSSFEAAKLSASMIKAKYNYRIVLVHNLSVETTLVESVPE